MCDPRGLGWIVILSVSEGSLRICNPRQLGRDPSLTLRVTVRSSAELGGNMVLALNQAARIVPSRYVTEPYVAR